MRSRFGIALAACAAILSVLPILAGQPAAGWREDEPRAYPPAHHPDRIILTWRGDPATTQAVTWRTDDTVTSALAQIALADPSPDFTETARDVPAETTPLRTETGTAHFHAAEFIGLQPNTLYVYRVGSDRAWSEWFQFRTASRAAEPFSFLYFGDIQNAILSHASRTLRTAYSRTAEVRFLLFAGDLVNHSNSDGEWGEWFAAGGWIYAMVPTVPTPGNHEYRWDEREEYWLSRYWRPQFTLPENGPPGLEETVYYLDYQNLRVVSLNSNVKLQEQASWLDRVLGSNVKRWTVLTFHHPVYSAAQGRDNLEVGKHWKPILEKHRVDLVLQGHDHAYARGTGRPSLGDPHDVEGGVVYVVSIAGPKQYELTDNRWMERAAENTQLYQVISVGQDTLRYQAFTTTGELYDAFDLVKRRGERNLVLDRTPNGVPERTFSAD